MFKWPDIIKIAQIFIYVNSNYFHGLTKLQKKNTDKSTDILSLANKDYIILLQLFYKKEKEIEKK